MSHEEYTINQIQTLSTSQFQYTLLWCSSTIIMILLVTLIWKEQLKCVLNNSRKRIPSSLVLVTEPRSQQFIKLLSHCYHQWDGKNSSKISYYMWAILANNPPYITHRKCKLLIEHQWANAFSYSCSLGSVVNNTTWVWRHIRRQKLVIAKFMQAITGL